MMDQRLSKPKNRESVPVEVNSSYERVKLFRNSSPELQIPHQQNFYKTSWAKFGSPEKENGVRPNSEVLQLADSRTFQKSFHKGGQNQ